MDRLARDPEALHGDRDIFWKSISQLIKLNILQVLRVIHKATGHWTLIVLFSKHGLDLLRFGTRDQCAAFGNLADRFYFWNDVFSIDFVDFISKLCIYHGLFDEEVTFCFVQVANDSL